jgi:hypothetical protein
MGPWRWICTLTHLCLRKEPAERGRALVLVGLQFGLGEEEAVVVDPGVPVRGPVLAAEHCTGKPAYICPEDLGASLVEEGVRAALPAKEDDPAAPDSNLLTAFLHDVGTWRQVSADPEALPAGFPFSGDWTLLGVKVD